MAHEELTLASCGCGNKPTWGRLTFYNAQGEFVRHDAIRCLHCHYWFYINGQKQKTATRWNKAARNRAEALITAQAEIEALRNLLAEIVPPKLIGESHDPYPEGKTTILMDWDWLKRARTTLGEQP